MKHAGPDTLRGLEPLVAKLRGLDGVREKGRGVFYVGGRAFVHFHEDPQGPFCDIRLDPGEDFTRRRVATEAERAALLAEAKRCLARHGQRGRKPT